jgi:lipopolysaccharide transport system permease protein
MMWKIAVDLAVAAAAYVAAWRLQTDELTASAPAPGSALLIVVLLQVTGALVLRAYQAAPIVAVLRRFTLGVAAGSLAGGVLLILIYGRQTVAATTLAADALLLVIGGLLWRSANGVFRLTRARPVSTGATPPGMSPVGGRRSLLLGIGDLVRYRSLAQNLVFRDLKLKYRGSALGFAWSLLNPIVMVAVYTVAFTYFLKIHQPGFVLHLMLGLLAWTFFANSAIMATGAIVDSGGLLKSIYFPRSILPLSTVLFNLSQYLLTIVVFLPIMFAFYRVVPSTPMLAFPFVLLLQVLFTIGVAFTLAALTAIYRDVKHLTEIALTVLFWMTPIVYATANLPEQAQLVISLSPMTPFVTAYQAMFYDQVWPDAWTMAVAMLYATVTPLVGATLFFSLEERFVEQI